MDNDSLDIIETAISDVNDSIKFKKRSVTHTLLGLFILWLLVFLSIFVLYFNQLSLNKKLDGLSHKAKTDAEMVLKRYNDNLKEYLNANYEKLSDLVYSTQFVMLMTNVSLKTPRTPYAIESEDIIKFSKPIEDHSIEEADLLAQGLEVAFFLVESFDENKFEYKLHEDSFFEKDYSNLVQTDELGKQIEKHAESSRNLIVSTQPIVIICTFSLLISGVFVSLYKFHLNKISQLEEKLTEWQKLKISLLLVQDGSIENTEKQNLQKLLTINSGIEQTSETSSGHISADIFLELIEKLTKKT